MPVKTFAHHPDKTIQPAAGRKEQNQNFFAKSLRPLLTESPMNFPQTRHVLSERHDQSPQEI